MRTLILFLLTFSLVSMVNPNVFAQHLKWKLGTSPIIETPAINDKGTIFFARPNDSKLYAVNPDGSTKWINNKLHPRINSCPAIGPKGNIYIGGNYKKLCSINPDSGSIQWCYPFEAKLNNTPAIAQDGTVYANPYNKKLYAINPDGTKKWIFEHSGKRAGSSPSIGKDGTIYLADMSLYAINNNGDLKWKYKGLPENAFEYAPAIGSDGTVYVGCSFQGSVHAITPQGNKKWINTSENKAGIYCTPAIGPEGTIYVSRLIANNPYNALYAINPNGNTKWNTEIKSNILFSPTVGKDGTIYVGTMYNPENQEIGSSAIYAINPSDGSIKWRYSFDVTMAGQQPTPTIAPDGTLYVGALYAIQTDSKGLANSSWPIFHHDQKNTGRINDSPAPKIKANSSDKPITINPNDKLSVTVSLDPGGQEGQGDYWVAASTPYGWYFLNNNLVWQNNLTRCIKAPIQNIKAVPIFKDKFSVPTGKYTFYFAVDDTPDGDLENDNLWFDSIEVNVQ